LGILEREEKRDYIPGSPILLIKRSRDMLERLAILVTGVRRFEAPISPSKLLSRLSVRL